MNRAVLAHSGLSVFVFAVMPLLAQDSTPASARRVGIVVANSGYGKLKPLPSAAVEGELISGALKSAGFSVRVVNDATRSAILNLDAQLDSMVKPGDAVFFYFSGYAIQDEEDNYLVPVDFDPAQDSPIELRAYHLSRLAQRLQRLGAGLKVLMIEGCRTIGATIPGVTLPGLMEPNLDFSSETLYAFSASTGQTSKDATDSVAQFTRAAADRMDLPGSRLMDVFSGAKTEVFKKSGGAQTPQVRENVVLNDQFFFRVPAPPKAVVSEGPAIAQKFAFVPVQNPRDRQEYVLLPAGQFLMGCVPGDKLCEKDEQPQHRVRISKGFWMGRNEAEVIAFQRYVEAQGQAGRMPPWPLWNAKWRITNKPIVNVSADNARGFCEWAGGRLPTEVEWEYAARSGKDNEIYPLNDENSRDKANFAGKKGNDRFDDEAAPVRSFDPSPWNLYDLAGNVWEIVNDFYSATYYSESPEVDPRGPAAGKRNIKRGGSFDSDAKIHLRISIRRSFVKPDNATGFRCVLEDNEATRKLLRVPQ